MNAAGRNDVKKSSATQVICTSRVHIYDNLPTSVSRGNLTLFLPNQPQTILALQNKMRFRALPHLRERLSVRLDIVRPPQHERDRLGPLPVVLRLLP